ncbi:MAG: hypothetical protein WBA57_19105 [Elainellaceae cyanobacterium]
MSYQHYRNYWNSGLFLQGHPAPFNSQPSLIVTHCTTQQPECPEQQIISMTPLLGNDSQLDQGDLETLLSTSLPYQGLHKSGDQSGNTQNTAAGRIYYVREVQLGFWQSYLQSLRNLPENLSKGNQLSQSYGVTLLLLLATGFGLWIVVEVLQVQKRQQKRKIGKTHAKLYQAQQQIRHAQRLTQDLDRQLHKKNIQLAEQEQLRYQLNQFTQERETVLQQQHLLQTENDAKLAALETELQVLQDQSAATQEEIQQRSDQISQLQKQIQDQRHQNQQISEQNAHFQAELADYNQQLDEATQRIEHLTAFVKTLQQERDEAVTLSQSIQAGRRAVELTNQDADQLLQDLQGAQVELEESQNKIVDLEQELSDAREIEAEALAENTRFADEREELTQAIDHLNNQLAIARSTGERWSFQEAEAQPREYIIVLKATEKDLYAHEKKDLLLTFLKKSVDSIHAKSRQRHILQDILASNQMHGQRQSIEETLRSLLPGHRKMNAKTRRVLNKLGFTISQDGKHYKIVFRGDPRYSFSLPKTGSDSRGGANLLSDIRRRLL